MFEERYDQRSTYHSFEHTREVAEAAEKIGKESGLGDEELEVVVLAAWFHDTGYLFDPGDHETASAGVAEKFLQGEGYPSEKITRVLSCIQSTRMDAIPKSLMEEVIHDADYINLASDDNLRQAEQLKNEHVQDGAREPSEEEWLAEELKFLQNHKYYTSYGIKKLEEKKKENMKKIKKKLKKIHGKKGFAEDPFMPGKNGVSASLDKKKVFSVKGFDSIYRLTVTNHMRLNAIADRKANLMLTLNGVIISIILSVVASDSDYNPRLLVPTTLLIIVCTVAIIFATLSTRPKVTEGNIRKEDVDKKKANLLFFGNFSRMDYDEFDDGMRKLIIDQEYLHNSMIRDFYDLGKVLDMKFRYLRICYNIFMYGLIATVLSVGVLILVGY